MCPLLLGSADRNKEEGVNNTNERDRLCGDEAFMGQDRASKIGVATGPMCAAWTIQSETRRNITTINSCEAGGCKYRSSNRP